MKLSRKLVTHALYYIAHPLFTYGSPDLNRSLVKFVEMRLSKMGIFYISPLSIIPPNTPEPKAMEKCECLLMACDGIILCKNWQRSKGCQHERMFAEKLGLEILEMRR